LAESRQHIELVSTLGRWVRNSSFLGDDPIVFLDSPDSSVQDMPSTLNGHRPDVFAQSRVSERQIIAEAKTPNDLDTRRSLVQIESFLNVVQDHRDCAFLIATRWDHVRYAGSTISKICDELGFSYAKYGVIDEFGNLVVCSHDWV
jgi:hypothetical protein